MKKIVLLLVALVLFSSVVYADVGVGIWGRTVFTLVYGTVPEEDSGLDMLIFQGWGPDWGGAGGPQMGIAVWWTSDLMEYHFKYKYNNVDAAGAMIPEAWGIIKILPAYGVTLQLGYREEQNDFRETTATTFRDMNSADCGRMNRWGAVIMIEPPDMGLKVAIQYRDSLTDYPIQYDLLNTGIAMSYTVPEMVKITVGSMTEGPAWTDNVFPNNQRNIFGRIHLLMVPDLTCWLLVKYTGLEPASDEVEAVDTTGDGTGDTLPGTSDETAIDVLLGVKYVMGDFSIASGINFTQTTPKGDDPIARSDIHANIDPAYNLGKMGVGAVIGMKMQMDDDGVDEDLGIYFEPYVKIPDFNMNIAFKLSVGEDLNPDTSDISWSLPIQVDFSFW
jgi:hypothetical protein